MSEWKGTRITNLVRRDGKVYYAQIKIAGKVYRRSLGTAKLDVARVKLELTLREIREDVLVEQRPPSDLVTLGGCIEAHFRDQERRPDIGASTKQYYQRCRKALEDTLPCDATAVVLGEDMLMDWWEEVAERWHHTFANNLLSKLVAVLELQVEAGYRKDNPARKLKRVRGVQEIRWMPSPEEFAAIIRHVRGKKKTHSEESADFMSWVAFTGMRPGEVEPLGWHDVGVDRITVRGGASSTKNNRERMVPIIPAAMELVAKRRQRGGTVFYIKSPRIALRNACRELGLPHLRLYDLRHLFVTRSIESGVDFGTIAKWIGHSDGGALVARVYGHVRDAHGLEQAKRVDFFVPM